MNDYVITYTIFKNNKSETFKVLSKGNTPVEAKFKTVYNLINAQNPPSKFTIDDIERV